MLPGSDIYCYLRLETLWLLLQPTCLIVMPHKEGRRKSSVNMTNPVEITITGYFGSYLLWPVFMSENNRHNYAHRKQPSQLCTA